MKITVFKANDGDCLLLHGEDDTVMLVDGGRKQSFETHTLPTLDSLRSDGIDVDLVCVSHIDNDHISGVLGLVDQIIAWRVYDFQRDTGNSRFKKPGKHRPAGVRHIWHNAFRDIVGENAGPIQDLLVLAGRSMLHSAALSPYLEIIDNLVTGVNEGVELSLRLGQNLRDIKFNAPFNGGLMRRTDPPDKVAVGGFSVRILGPTTEDLEELRTEWNDFLQSTRSRVDEIRREVEEEGRNLGLSELEMLERSLLALSNEFVNLGEGTITIPNIASLVLLVEERHDRRVRRVLLTGDAGSKEILAGLNAHGLIDMENGQGIHVDVLKVQHHGALANVTREFCEYVTADYYIFCGNGSHHNPELEVVEAFYDARLGNIADDSKSPGVDGDFKFWFSSSEGAANTESRKKHMRKVERLVDKLKRRDDAGKFSTRFLRNTSKASFTI